MGCVKGTFWLVKTGACELIPALTFFNAFKIFIHINGFLKQILVTEIILILAVVQCQGGMSCKLATCDSKVVFTKCSPGTSFTSFALILLAINIAHANKTINAYLCIVEIFIP